MSEEYSLQIQIDRLSDNELSHEQSSELMARLDSEPEGWKTCALTLLEAREVARALLSLRSDEHCPVPIRRASIVRRLTIPVTVICLSGLAFLLGRFSVPEATANMASDSILHSTDTVKSENSVVNEDAGDGAFDVPGGAPTIMEADHQFAIVGFAQMYQESGTGPRVPVIAGHLSEADLMHLPTSVPDHVRRRANNNGLHVEHLRRVMSVELVDGQRFAVPMDAVGLKFVGHPVL